MTVTATQVTDRAAMALDYFTRLHGDHEGFVMLAHGVPYVNESGKVQHHNFIETPFRWPAEAGNLVATVVELSTSRDVWTTPGLSANPTRNMDLRKSMRSWFLWSDLDGASEADLFLLAELAVAGSFTVASGRGDGHRHGYIMLDEPAGAAIVAELNRRLARVLHGDGSPAALNGYLRPPGSYNHKPTVLDPGSGPVLVTMAADTSGTGWAVSDLDEMLPDDGDLSGAPVDVPDPVEVDGDLPPEIAAILEDKTTKKVDRSARLYKLVGLCRTAGYDDGETLGICRRHRPSQIKYGRRQDGEIARVLGKIPADPDAVRRRRTESDQPSYFEHSDLGNAKRLIHDHGQDLHRSPQLGVWYAWDGHQWVEDLTGETHRRAKAVGETILNEAYAKGNTKGFAFGIKTQSAAGINNMLILAATEPGIPILIDQMDTNPMVLNVANGTIDLATGEIRPHRRDDLLTKMAPVAYDPHAGCPTFDRFLTEVFLDDQELIGFVRRYAGYSLTGDVSEQVLAFCHGTGANGKSTLLNALRHVVGDYGIQLDPAVLTVAAHEQHPTGLTDLLGARLVSTIETEAGKRLNEALVKQLTGGDPIRARRMHKDFYEFLPSHKLWFAGNHLPRIDGTDHGIWRRLALIPFHARFDNGQADKNLPAKLASEAPGILAWMVQGCLEWQRDGLQIPAAVKAATNDYRTTQDHVGRFLADACVTDDHATVTARALRAAYETWCSEQGERPWSAQAVGRELSSRGYDRTGGGRAGHSWLGIDVAEVAG